MSSASPRWMPIAGLGALVILNVVLIALLVIRPSSPTVAEQHEPYVPPSTPLGDAEEEPVTKSEPAELPTAEVSDGLAPAARLIVNADDTTAWRATVGDCDDPGTLERTVDAGATWEELPLDIAPVSRVRVLSSQGLFVIGGGEDCAPTYVSSATRGTSWATNDQFLVGSWFIVPGDRDVVATPVGEVEAPCAVTELAAFDAFNAAMLCANGNLAVTDDGGASWEETVADLDVRALGVADDGYALAGALEECGDDVAVLVTDPTGSSTEKPSCAEASVSEGPLAVSADGGAVWLWVGDDVIVVNPGPA